MSYPVAIAVSSVQAALNDSPMGCFDYYCV